MALEAGTVYCTVNADMRPFRDGLEHAADLLVVTTSTSARERARAYNSLYRRGLTNAAEWWDTLRRTRARANPLRLVDRWHAAACRRQAARMEVE